MEIDDDDDDDEHIYSAKQKKSLDTDVFVTCKALSHSGGMLYMRHVTGEDQVVKVWDLASGMLLRDLHGHSDFIYSLAFSNDSALLASGQFLCCTHSRALLAGVHYYGRPM